MTSTVVLVHGAFAESASWNLPGSTLGDVLEPVLRADGTTDLTIARENFHAQFAADVPATDAARMAVTQRPIAREALLEPSGDRPLWKALPSWFVFGELDRNIPCAAHHHMAERARAHRTLEVPGASHAVNVAHPWATAHLILEAIMRRAHAHHSPATAGAAGPSE
jgi:pimeloyl-ACP methyl ester carboxylesterase